MFFKHYERCKIVTNYYVNRTVLILALGILSIVSMSCYTGLVVYAAYHDCDPVSTKVRKYFKSLKLSMLWSSLTFQLVSKSDQILPFFVTQIARNLPGLPGLFVAGVFSAALRYKMQNSALFGLLIFLKFSSMSTGLNSITGVVYEDFVKPSSKKPWSEAKASALMKVVVVIAGTICVALVFMVERMGAVIQVIIC